MRILFVLECANLNTNGTTASCVRFAEELRKKGHDVRILGCKYNDPSKTPEYYVPLEPFHFPIFQGLIEKEGFCFAKINEKLIYEEVKKADVVHVFLAFKPSKHAMLIAQALGKPVTTAFHLQPQNITSPLHMAKVPGANRLLFYGFRKYLYDYIDHCHCPSSMIATELYEHNYKNTKAHVISNGINEFFHPVEVKKPAEFEDKFVVTCVGRFAPEKRQDLLIRAVAASKYRKNIQLIFCGQGPNKKRCMRLIKKMKFENEPIVKFVKKEELREILNYTDLYVHASDFEIEGISCIEGMACGTVPLISNAKLSATKDFALSEHCLFEHGDYESLRDGIDHFIEHPEELNDLKGRYLEYSKEFELNRSVSKFEEMLVEAINDEKSGRSVHILSPRKKDIKYARRIFKKLLKQGAIEKIPDSLA